MSNGFSRMPFAWPIFGCLGMALSMFFLCLMPFILVDTMRAALERLHLRPDAALLAVIGIFAGGLINLPVHRITRSEDQPIETFGPLGLSGWAPRFYRTRRDTIIAVNVGGCIVPSALAAWETMHLLPLGGGIVTSLAIAVALNIAVCYRVSRPVRGIGIAMPGLISPLVAIGAAWLMLSADKFDPIRAPVAFVAGVVGPLVGADLLHLKDITRISTGVLSIGGAGTFDGIVLSGVLAALLA